MRNRSKFLRRFNRAAPAWVLMTGIIPLMAASDAQALEVPLTVSANAVSHCQAALPVFDGQLRKRPLAVQNEGASNAFVTCAFIRNMSRSTMFRVVVFAENTGESSREMSCTLVAGTAGGGRQVPRTTQLPAGASVRMQWIASDFNGTEFSTAPINMSCNVPPGVGLNDMYMETMQDVGA